MTSEREERRARANRSRQRRDQRLRDRELARLADAIDAELLIGEMTAEVIAAEAAADRNIPNGLRPLTKAEFASGIKFGRIQRRTRAIADRLLTHTDLIADHITRELPDHLATSGSVRDAQRRLRDLSSPLTGSSLPGLADVVTQARNRIAADLEDGWGPAADDVRAEATHQGGTVPASSTPISGSGLALIAGAAAAIATYRAQRMLTVAVASAQAPPATVPELVSVIRDAITAVDPAGTLDMARQSAHQVENAARTEQAQADGMPPIASVYASELLDGKTCDVCAEADGTEYATLQDALIDYLEDGGNRHCEGGDRCRGVLVEVYDTEATPTLDTPYGAPQDDPTGTPPPDPGPPPPPGNTNPPTTGTPAGPPEPWAVAVDPVAAVHADISRVFTDITAPHGITVASTASRSPRGVTVNMEGTTRTGRQAFVAVRTVDIPAVTVHHDYFKISPAFRGRGIATRMLDESFDVYRAQGMHTVKVHANIDVGGYSWAKLGFEWDIDYYGSLAAIKNEADDLLDRIVTLGRPATPAEVAEVDWIRDRIATATSILDVPSPGDLARIGFTPGAADWVGKVGMLGSDWYGKWAL